MAEAKCISAVTPTVCKLMDVKPPALSEEGGIEVVIAAGKAVFGGKTVERCLFYAPDCIGTSMVERLPEKMNRVRKLAPVEVPLRAAFPPKTPVCFASMLTGAQPAQHGIQDYVKPVLACDTIFDAMVRAGKRCSIASVTGCSMDRIFRQRPIDYHDFADDDEVIGRTLELLAADAADFLVCYQIGYDKWGHRTGPYSDTSIEQIERKVTNFERVVAAAAKAWQGKRWIVTWSPDHGSHTDPASGKADHGLDISLDMDVRHFFGFYGT